MKKTTNILVSVLFFWFTLDLSGMKIGNLNLVDGSCINDEPIDVVWWVIFLICFIIFILKDKVGKYILLSFVSIWCFLIQYPIYFRSAKRIEDYNNYFKKTHHIIPPSNNFLIKDTYHIFLDLFLFIVLISLIVFIIKSRRNQN